MSHRLACEHERWANQRNARAEQRRREPLVMGPNESCIWCAKDAGRRLSADVTRHAIERADKAEAAIATAEARARAMVETLHLAQHTLIEHHAAGEPLEPGEMCGKCVKPGFSIFIEIEAALRGEPAPSIPIVEVGLAQLIAERDALKERVEELGLRLDASDESLLDALRVESASLRKRIKELEGHGQ